jgi:hypothetical protein
MHRIELSKTVRIVVKPIKGTNLWRCLSQQQIEGKWRNFAPIMPLGVDGLEHLDAMRHAISYAGRVMSRVQEYKDSKDLVEKNS